MRGKRLQLRPHVAANALDAEFPGGHLEQQSLDEGTAHRQTDEGDDRRRQHERCGLGGCGGFALQRVDQRRDHERRTPGGGKQGEAEGENTQQQPGPRNKGSFHDAQRGGGAQVAAHESGTPEGGTHAGVGHDPPGATDLADRVLAAHFDAAAAGVGEPHPSGVDAFDKAEVVTVNMDHNLFPLFEGLTDDPDPPFVLEGWDVEVEQEEPDGGGGHAVPTNLVLGAKPVQVGVDAQPTQDHCGACQAAFGGARLQK